MRQGIRRCKDDACYYTHAHYCKRQVLDRPVRRRTLGSGPDGSSKPQIPLIGDNDIPIRDEIELEWLFSEERNEHSYQTGPAIQG